LAINIDTVFWGGTALVVLMLMRAVYAPSLRRCYPLFYIYLLCVFATDLARFCCYRAKPNFYRTFYWDSELLLAVASYGVLVDIFRQATKHRPGAERVIKKVLLYLFVASVACSAASLCGLSTASLARVIATLGRDLHYAECLLMVVMLWLVSRYRLYVGANLLGLAVGYSVWITINALALALMFLGRNELSDLLRRGLPMVFVFTLLTWCLTMWSFRAEHLSDDRETEVDYPFLASQTNGALWRACERFWGVGRT
jgi:hypothetical protein